MVEIAVSHEFNAPAARIWSLLENFGDLQAWWPKEGLLRIARVENEGEGIGMIRHIYNEGMTTPISEQLDYLDPASKTLKLSIVGQLPTGMISYNATGTISETGPGSCRFDYRGVVNGTPEMEAGLEQFLRTAYAQMFQGLADAARR